MRDPTREVDAPSSSLSRFGPLPLMSATLCDPVLVLGLPPEMAEDLHDVYRNDLVYSRTSTLKSKLCPTGTKLELQDSTLWHILNCLDGPSLMNLCTVFGGPIVYHDNPTNKQEATALTSRLLQNGPFQAIVVADFSLFSIVEDDDYDDFDDEDLDDDVPVEPPRRDRRHSWSLSCSNTNRVWRSCSWPCVAIPILIICATALACRGPTWPTNDGSCN